jgi:hypothetical protein
MLLKAGTYKFNDVLNIDSDITCAINVTAPLLMEALGDDVPFISIETRNELWSDDGNTLLGGSGLLYGITEDRKFQVYGFVEAFDWNGWLSNWYTSSMGVNITDEMLQTHTLPADQEVDDTFGTWYISNTNYNEVNPTVDTIYTEKSSWYKSVADAIRNKKGTSAPILRDDFAREIESISVGEEVAEYDGTVVIEKAESGLGLRRFKDTMSNIEPPTDFTEEGFTNFYNNNSISIETLVLSEKEELYGFTPPFEAEGDIYTIMYYNDDTTIEGGDIRILPYPFETLKSWFTEFTVTATAPILAQA